MNPLLDVLRCKCRKLIRQIEIAASPRGDDVEAYDEYCVETLAKSARLGGQTRKGIYSCQGHDIVIGLEAFEAKSMYPCISEISISIFEEPQKLVGILTFEVR